MSTIYVDSRRRVSGSDSNFTFELPETLHMQSSAKMAVYKVRIADAFLSTDWGRNLYWIDQALPTLNSAQLPIGAYTGARLAAWISSNYSSATYVEAQNSIEVASDGNRRILSHAELRDLFPNGPGYPRGPMPPAPKASTTCWGAATSTVPFKSSLGSPWRTRFTSIQGAGQRGAHPGAVGHRHNLQGDHRQGRGPRHEGPNGRRLER